MTSTNQQQSFAPDFDRSAPAYLWWNGKIVPWDSATVHLTSTFWSGVTAIFEGIMSYWNEDAGELYVWQLDAHLRRLLRSQKLMRQELPYTVAELTEAVLQPGARAARRLGHLYLPVLLPEGRRQLREQHHPGAAAGRDLDHRAAQPLAPRQGLGAQRLRLVLHPHLG